MRDIKFYNDFAFGRRGISTSSNHHAYHYAHFNSIMGVFLHVICRNKQVTLVVRIWGDFFWPM